MVPKDMRKYYNFVYNTVKRTKGKVRFFENDFEADIDKHWSGTAKEYLTTLKTFYRAVKDANPEATVIMGGHSGSFTNGEPNQKAFFDLLFKEGSEYFDLLDLHLYGKIYDIPYRVGWFNKRMTELGLNKGIVAIEYGGPTPLEFPASEWQKIGEAGRKDITILTKGLKGYPDKYRIFAMNIPKDLEEKRNRIQAREFTQRTILALSSGVRMLLWWNIKSQIGNIKGHKIINPIFGKLSLVDNDLKPKPNFNYYRIMSAQLSGVKRVVRVPAGKDDIYLFNIEKGDGTNKYVIWHMRDIVEGEKEGMVPYKFKTDWQRMKVTDVFGNTKRISSNNGAAALEISDTPLYLERGGTE